MQKLITIKQEFETIEYELNANIINLSTEDKLIIIGRLEEIKQDLLNTLYNSIKIKGN